MALPDFPQQAEFHLVIIQINFVVGFFFVWLVLRKVLHKGNGSPSCIFNVLV